MKRFKQYGRCQCCGHNLYIHDPYYSTPCGPWCSHCMNKVHGWRECWVCAEIYGTRTLLPTWTAREQSEIKLNGKEEIKTE